MQMAQSIDELLKMLRDDHPLHIELTKKLERLQALETIHPFTSRMMREHDYELLPPGSKEAIREAGRLLRAAPLREDVEDLISNKARKAYLDAVETWLTSPAVKSAEKVT